ncbi:hypothetical protein IFO70_37225 [Phormidium tenue FACHB-886]|nr:hypothetical protein [Phormidium tenue FACHB-886]
MVAQQFLQLSGLTRANRIQMSDRVSEAINQAGWITNFHLYSNILICINFELPLSKLSKLAASLQETGLHLSQESLEQLRPANNSTLKQQELAGTLQITFIHDKPDLIREVPAVPG